jgi:ABC-type sugar transport system permease subunit
MPGRWHRQRPDSGGGAGRPPGSRRRCSSFRPRHRCSRSRVYPILNGLWLSFRDTSLISPEDRFVGLQNYVVLLSDAQFWNAWKHTVQFTAASTLLGTVLGLAMALVLHETFRGRGMVRAAMLVPWAIPTVVTSKMFGWLFDGQNGLVNHALQGLGLISENIGWYSSPDYALLTIVIADVWKTTPFMALLLLAGLQTIPGSLREASLSTAPMPGSISGMSPCRCCCRPC